MEVPEGWELARVDSRGIVFVGRQRGPKFVTGVIRPYLRVANVFENRIDVSDVKQMYFTEKEFKKYRLVYGDILLNEGQSLELVGRSAQYKGVPPNCCFQNTLINFRVKENTFSDFAIQLFLYCLHRGEFQRIAKQTTSVAHLGVSRFAELRLLWPSFQEQIKIAEILSTWDKAIATTEKLIENSKAQKKALMQQLLTGKKRLPGFEGGTGITAEDKNESKYPLDWAKVKIKDIAEEKRERNGDAIGIPVVSCTKYVGFVDSLKYFNKKVFSDDVSNYKLIRYGQFGYPSNHIEEGSIGLQDLYDKAIVSPIYIVFEVGNAVDEYFMYSLLKTERYRQTFSMMTNSSVDRRGSLRWKTFADIVLYLPSIDEQNRITELVKTVDNLIQAQSGYLNNLKRQKSALLQQLLTGKRRVKIDEAA